MMLFQATSGGARAVGRFLPGQVSSLTLACHAKIPMKTKTETHFAQRRYHGANERIEGSHGHSHGTSIKDLLLHSHAHPHGDIKEDLKQMSPEMQEREMRITRWGLYSNILLTIGKFIAGILGNSSALIADGVHSVSDMLSDAVTMLTIKHASLPADREHPYGHGKIEDLGTGVISGVLVLTGLGIGWHAVDNIMDIMHLHSATHDHVLDPAVQTTIDAFKNADITPADTIAAANGTAAETTSFLARVKHLFAEGLAEGHGHGHGPDAHTPTALALGAAVVSVLVKEALFHMTMRVAKDTNSKIVEVNAWHHRSDALSSLIAVVGVAGAMLHVPVLDPLAAFIVAGLITKQGWDMGREVFHAITDHDIEDDVKASVEASLRKCAYYGLVGYHDLRGRKMGRYCVLDVNVVVSPTLSVSAAHQVAETVRQVVLADNTDVSQIHVHVDVDGDLDAAESHAGGAHNPLGAVRAQCSECGTVTNRVLARSSAAVQEKTESQDRRGPEGTVAHSHGPEAAAAHSHGFVHGHVDLGASHEHPLHHSHGAHGPHEGILCAEDVVYVDEVVVDESNIDHVNACIEGLNRRLTAKASGASETPATEGHDHEREHEHEHGEHDHAHADQDHVPAAHNSHCAPGHSRLMRSVLAIEYDVKRIVARPKYAQNFRLCVHGITPHFVHGHLSVDIEVALGGYCSSACSPAPAADAAAAAAPVAKSSPCGTCGSSCSKASADASPTSMPAGCGSKASADAAGASGVSPGVTVSLDELFAAAAALKSDIERGVPDIECANITLRLSR